MKSFSFTPLGEPMIDIFERLRTKGLLQPRKGFILKCPSPSFDLSKSCAYHSNIQGHDIEDCPALRFKIQSLIERGKIKLQQGPPINNDNVTNKVILFVKYGPSKLAPRRSIEIFVDNQVAIVISNNPVFTAIDLLEIMAEAGPGAFISPSEIAAQLPTKNPEAPVMLDRMFRLLSTYSVLNCTLRTLPDGCVEWLYSLAPVCVEQVGGDMFVIVPKADAIFELPTILPTNTGFRYLEWICHDWSNDHCIKLLKNCYEALPANGKVIIAECILPEAPDTSAATKSKVHGHIIMLAHNPGGKERTEKEFEALVKGASFRGFRKACCAYHTWIMEFNK
ncbi:Caffeic acid 3-O-methyltransferase [Capsicum chinense]|nr:Caffeic acid 3-O-methyltransferase [Capsicum chinense]